MRSVLKGERNRWMVWDGAGMVAVRGQGWRAMRFPWEGLKGCDSVSAEGTD